MEAQLFNALHCPPGSRVLDAGLGVGHLALYMARAGDYRIERIDVVAGHVAKAKRNLFNAGMDAGIEAAISARLGDYHHLEDFSDNSFDVIYPIETLVHSTDPFGVLREYLRLLKLGGRIALNEYDHDDLEKAPKEIADSMKKVNKYAAMPANASFDRDFLKELLQEAGFEDVHSRDLSEHIVPILWLFYLLAIILYLLFKLLGIQHCFVNTLAGMESYRGPHLWRYIQIIGKKGACST
jgi:sterol 24-C-methyltransferase